MRQIITAIVLSLGSALLLSCGCVGGGTCSTSVVTSETGGSTMPATLAADGTTADASAPAKGEDIGFGCGGVIEDEATPTQAHPTDG